MGRLGGDVWFVEPGSLSESAQITPALAALPGTDAAGSTTDVMVNSLNEHGALIIMDNCEHPLETTSKLVSDPLGRSPGTRFHATGRESLGVNEQLARGCPEQTGDHDVNDLTSEAVAEREVCL